MVATQGIRSGGRAKFSNMRDMKAAMDKAAGNKPEGETVEGEFKITQPEQGKAVETREVVATVTRSSVTPGSCVRALEKAIGFGRSALYLEVAVSLAVFASSTTGADRATKRVVMDIYAQAGFDVSPTGRDYKTVNRRVNVSADLFNKLGEDAVKQAMHGLRDGKAIESLTSYLGEDIKFDSINALLEYVGKPVEQTNTPEVRAARAAKEAAENNAAAVGINDRIAARRAEREKQQAEDVDGIIINAGKLSVVLPRDCTADEVMMLVAKLTDYATRLAEEAGTPEEQHNRALHS